MKLKKIVYLTLGFLGLALGAVGAVLPLLPAFPFLLMAAVCFGKSSEKLDRCSAPPNCTRITWNPMWQGRG